MRRRAIALVTTDTLTPEQQAGILADIRRARTRDPLSAWVLSVESMSLACLGRVAEGIASAERAVSMDPENFTAHWTRVLTYAWAERDEDALRAAAAALAMSGRHPRVLAEVAAVHAKLGEVDAAMAISLGLRQRARSQLIGFAEHAAVAASAGDLDAARAFIHQAIAARDPYLRFWKSPAWRAVWADPAAAALLRNSALFR